MNGSLNSVSNCLKVVDTRRSRSTSTFTMRTSCYDGVMGKSNVRQSNLSQDG
jgi:hypothetical protein